MNEGNDPILRSWVEAANEANCDFPIQNLPFGVFSRRAGPADVRRVGVAIGNHVLDLAEAWPELCPESALLGFELFDEPSLNMFLAAGREMWIHVRETVSGWLRDDSSELRGNASLRRRALIPISEVRLHLPIEIGDYTDFYASEYHATNVGSMFRPDTPLLPNWKHVPVGYHGRASSIVVSGTNLHRPWGQIKADDANTPSFRPCRLLDYELEVGLVVGPGNELGQPIPMSQIPNHIFGLVLVNDWSARDIQKWEYQPLGPFLAKNFGTTIGPWVVPLDALEPFRTLTPRKEGDPKVQPYLEGAMDWGIDLDLQVAIRSAVMREKNLPPHVVTKTNFKHMYWNICHQLAHQTVSGCNVSPGDLCASGTVSGPERDSRGCMLELCWRGTEPLTLPTGEKRAFLADGDEVIITGHCGGRDGQPGIGFGECRGLILPAIEPFA